MEHRPSINWAARLKEAYCDKVETPEPGYMTSAEIAKASGASDVHGRAMLRKAVENGYFKVKKFRIQTGSRIMPVPHYLWIGPQ